MKPARKTHQLGRDANGMLVQIVEAGKVFVLNRQAGQGSMGMVSITLTAEQIADMNTVANPAKPA